MKGGDEERMIVPEDERWGGGEEGERGRGHVDEMRRREREEDRRIGGA